MVDHATTTADLEAKLQELTARAEGIDEDLRLLGGDDWSESFVEPAEEEVGNVTEDKVGKINRALSCITSDKFGVGVRSAQSRSPEKRLSAISCITRCVKCS